MLAQLCENRANARQCRECMSSTFCARSAECVIVYSMMSQCYGVDRSACPSIVMSAPCSFVHFNFDLHLPSCGPRAGNQGSWWVVISPAAISHAAAPLKSGAIAYRLRAIARTWIEFELAARSAEPILATSPVVPAPPIFEHRIAALAARDARLNQCGRERRECEPLIGWTRPSNVAFVAPSSVVFRRHVPCDCTACCRPYPQARRAHLLASVQRFRCARVHQRRSRSSPRRFAVGR